MTITIAFVKSICSNSNQKPIHEKELLGSLLSKAVNSLTAIIFKLNLIVITMTRKMSQWHLDEIRKENTNKIVLCQKKSSKMWQTQKRKKNEH